MMPTMMEIKMGMESMQVQIEQANGMHHVSDRKPKVCALISKSDSYSFVDIETFTHTACDTKVEIGKAQQQRDKRK